jgi:hypothetical protein
LVKGDGVQRGFDAGTRNIQDIAPTILYLAGLPIAGDMDGQVMFDVFEDRRLAGRSVYVVDACTRIIDRATPDDVVRESLEKKLRSLGYIR